MARFFIFFYSLKEIISVRLKNCFTIVNWKTDSHFHSSFTGGDDANGFAPSFIEKPRIIPNEAGTLITMKCRCKAKPAPVVTWYRGTTVVTESEKIAIKSSSTEEDIYELVLEIKVSEEIECSKRRPYNYLVRI